MTSTPSATAVNTSPAWCRELSALLQRVASPDRLAEDRDTATFAAWRRGLGKEPMSVPELWPALVPVVDAVDEGHGQKQSAVEAAVHHALCLYAVHQQSRREPMHLVSGPDPHRRRRTRTVGRTCRELHDLLQRDGGSSDGVDRRFRAAVTAETVPELTGHLRGLIPQLREKNIPLDYVTLARDLAAWPFHESRNKVRRTWGRDFYRSASTGPLTHPTDSQA